MSLVVIPYRTYTPEYFDRSEAEIIAVEHNGITGFIQWRKRYIGNMDHYSFHAGSDGWQPLTETGYKSFFMCAEEGTTEQAIKEWFSSECQDCFGDDYQHQPRLF